MPARSFRRQRVDHSPLTPVISLQISIASSYHAEAGRTSQEERRRWMDVDHPTRARLRRSYVGGTNNADPILTSARS